MKRMISMLLIVATLLTTFAVNVSAASNEEFISEVALVYEDSVEDAKAAIAGTDWKLYEQDLNPNADYMFDDGVYLIYKTSTNVEDAITDLRVMDMYGGYSISDYERQLEKSRAAYLEIIKYLRVAAAEFKSLYEAGDPMAAIAYRQMNYYKDVRTTNGTETNMSMGDFLLNLPGDEQIVQVLLEGNSYVGANLIALLAIGLSGSSDASLADKVAENYAIKDSFTAEQYYDKAKTLSEYMGNINAKLLRYDVLREEYDLSDENLDEEEVMFLSEYASLAAVLEEVKLGETNFADIIRTGNYAIEDLYPLVACFTDAQMALIKLGQIETVIKHYVPTQSIEDMEVLLEAAEERLKDENGTFQPIDVYLGVDRSIFDGSLAMTTAAERQQALTGETWDITKAADASGLLIASYVIAGFGAATACVGLGILAPALFYKVMSVATAKLFPHTIGAIIVKELGVNMYGSFLRTYMAMWGQGAYMMLAIAGGILLIAAGIAGIALWYNYYNPEYLEIPNTMIDVKETDLGDKYIKYSAAKVFEDGDLSEKNADFNAYEGKEWNALYYTKDATAGNCLTPKFVYSESNSTIARRHQGISMFGETEAFNLNSHVYNEDALGAYVTIRYSTTKKAAADVPTVVGSMFGGAFYALTALAGAGLGVGGTLLLQKAKKKKDEAEPSEVN